MKWWAIVAPVSSGQRLFLAYGSERRSAAAGTHNVQASMPH
jgi:hypothetical protein